MQLKEKKGNPYRVYGCKQIFLLTRCRIMQLNETDILKCFLLL